jgi:hypothetical protein
VSSSSSSSPTITTPQKVGSEFQVNTYTSGDQLSSGLTTLSDGKYVVAWESDGQDGSSWGTYAQIFDKEGTKFGSEFRLNTTINDIQIMPVLTPLDDGGFIAVWRDRTTDGNSYGTFGQVFDSAGNKVGNELQVNTTTYGNQFNPSIATLENGNVIVTWWDGAADGDEYGIFAQILSPSGAKIGGEFQVNTYTNDQQAAGEVSALKNGGFIVTWNSNGQDGDSTGIYMQIFDENGSKVGSETKINTTVSGSQSNPEVAQLLDGNLIISWQSDSQDGSGNGIYAQLLSNSGSSIGNEFLINEHTNGNQENSYIQPLSRGGFIAVWNSDGQDGD